MKRFEPLWKLLVIEFVALIVILSVYYFHLPIKCPFKIVTGLPCPGCGGTRALVALMQGHFIEAVSINPLSVLIIIFALIAPVWLFVDCYRGSDSLRRVIRGKWSKPTMIIVAVVIIVNWIWNIYKQL